MSYFEELLKDPDFVAKLESLVTVPTYKFAIREDLLNEETSFLPAKGEPLATGWDVKAAFKDRQPVTLRAGEYFMIPLGFRSFCPAGWWYQMNPRSSSFAKKNMHMLIGIIDETWEGETALVGQYLPDSKSLTNELVINFGDRLGQLIPVRRQEMIVEQISNAEYDADCLNREAHRGAGGFGSTGSK